MTAQDVDPLIAAMRRIAAEESERDEASDPPGDEAHASLQGGRAPSSGAVKVSLATPVAREADLAELLRPIDPPRRALAIAAARAALRGEEAPSGGDPPEASRGTSPSNVIPFRARDVRQSLPRALHEAGLDGPASGSKPQRPTRVARWAAIGSALALAAGVALFVGTRPPGIELPAYEASLVGGVRDVRADDAPRTFPPGKPLRVRLRPEHAVLAPVGVVVALRRGDRVTRADAALEALEGGALSVQVTLPAMEPGPAELLVLVGEPGALPSDARAEDLVDAPRHRLVRLPLVIGSP